MHGSMNLNFGFGFGLGFGLGLRFGLMCSEPRTVVGSFCEKLEPCTRVAFASVILRVTLCKYHLVHFRESVVPVWLAAAM